MSDMLTREDLKKLLQEKHSLLFNSCVLRHDAALRAEIDRLASGECEMIADLGEENNKLRAELVAKDAEIARLKSAIGVALPFVENMLGTMNNSDGIVGWHQNGDVLKWSDGHDQEMRVARDALSGVLGEKLRQYASVDSNHLDDWGKRFLDLVDPEHKIIPREESDATLMVDPRICKNTELLCYNCACEFYKSDNSIECSANRYMKITSEANNRKRHADCPCVPAIIKNEKE